MNYCGDTGYLVDSSTAIPVDPTDVHVDGLPLIGCSRIWCRHCKVYVRQMPGLWFRGRPPKDPSALFAMTDLAASPLLEKVTIPMRLYLCKCSSWTENSRHMLSTPPQDLDPAHDPTMPWQCNGHPKITPTYDVDGAELRSDTDVAAVATRVLDGWLPPRVREPDRHRWLCRLYMRLDPAHAHAIPEAALARLSDPDPQVRGRAIAVFWYVRDEAVLQRLIPLVEQANALYANVPDSISPIRDETLEDSVWRAILPLVKKSGPLGELARNVALAPGRAGRGVYTVVSTWDSDWTIANIEALVRANPNRVEALCSAFATFPDGKPVKTSRDRARAAAAKP